MVLSVACPVVIVCPRGSVLGALCAYGLASVGGQPFSHVTVVEYCDDGNHSSTQPLCSVGLPRELTSSAPGSKEEQVDAILKAAAPNLKKPTNFQRLPVSSTRGGQRLLNEFELDFSKTEISFPSCAEGTASSTGSGTSKQVKFKYLFIVYPKGAARIRNEEEQQQTMMMRGDDPATFTGVCITLPEGRVGDSVAEELLRFSGAKDKPKAAAVVASLASARDAALRRTPTPPPPPPGSTKDKGRSTGVWLPVAVVAVGLIVGAMFLKTTRNKT